MKELTRAVSKKQREEVDAPWWAGLVVFGLIYAMHWVQSVSAERRIRPREEQLTF